MLSRLRCLSQLSAAMGHACTQISFFCSDGGKDCFNFSALSLSAMISVYKYEAHRILNFVEVPFFFIFTDLASLRRAICKNWRISVICLGMIRKQTVYKATSTRIQTTTSP